MLFLQNEKRPNTSFISESMKVQKLEKDESYFHIHFGVFLKAKEQCTKLEASKTLFPQWLYFLMYIFIKL